MATERTLPRIALADAERLGFAVAANAERRLAGPVEEPLHVALLDPAGHIAGGVPAMDPETANAIAAVLRTAGWKTHTGGTR